MKCPHCGCESSRVMECRWAPEGLKRFRCCRKCGERFPTLETLAKPGRRGSKQTEPIASRPALSLVEGPGELPPGQAEPRRRAQERAAGFYPVALADIADDVRGLPGDLVDVLLRWWNNARRSRHGAKATWTRNAWDQSLSRIRALSPEAAMQLAQAGAEYGWMALKPEYGRQVHSRPALTASTGGRPLPKDPSMLAAIDSWPADPA